MNPTTRGLPRTRQFVPGSGAGALAQYLRSSAEEAQAAHASAAGASVVFQWLPVEDVDPLPPSVIKSLRQPTGRRAGWPAPTEETIEFARDLVDTAWNLGAPQLSGVVVSSPRGEVVMEWFRDGRRLTVTVNGTRAEFLRSSGPPGALVFQEGELMNDGKSFLEQMRWLEG